MAGEKEKLKIGKGSAFVKSQLHRLPQEDETWEADFRALPRPGKKKGRYYVGMVVTQPHGFLLAMSEIEKTPTVNDLSTLLANAMRRPLVHGKHRPRRILLRNAPKWQPLFPTLKELGIEVIVNPNLRRVNEAFGDFLNPVNEVRSTGKTKPTAEQAKVEKMFPAVAKWVQRFGHIEIGDQEGFGFVVRALDYGGLVFENDKAATLAEAMASLEKRLAAWFKDEGIEIGCNSPSACRKPLNSNALHGEC